MSTDVAIRDDAAAEPIAAQPTTQFTELSPLMRWTREAREVAVIARSLAQTSFVPRQFQGKPAEVTAAILAGQELGMGPMGSLRAIDIIEGKPALSALAMRGLVQSHGHDIWVVESTETRAIVCGRRNGSDIIQESTWDIDRARRMELLGKKNWRTQPKAMLIARATAEVCRLTASDVLVGMPYAAEELSDDRPADDELTADAPPAPKKRTAKRKPIPQPAAEEPPLDDMPANQEAEAPAPAPDPVEPALDDVDWPEVRQPPKGDE